MEDTDLYEWTRRPGFSIFCPTALADTEIVNEFYFMRNLQGEVIDFFDSSVRLATFTTAGLTPIIAKTTIGQGYITSVENMVYFSDGAAADMQKWDSATPFSVINPSPWGIPAPTLTPTIFSSGCWLPFTSFVINNAILDPNGNVEVVTAIFGGSGTTGNNQPLWPTTVASTINDGSIQWTNMGPLLAWLPAQFYPVPVVVLDTNGNLELATAVTPVVAAWNATEAYTVGTVVLSAGLYWSALFDNTGIAPSSTYAVTTTTGDSAVSQPYWVQTQSPSTTGTYSLTPFAPPWNLTVGGQTTDGNYVWTNLGPGVLVESFGTSYVYCYRTIYGHLSTASPVSLNTGSIFGPQVATITNFQITNDIVTFQGVNNFIPGSIFTVQGLSVGVYLNDQPFIVMATGLSPTQFSASFLFPNVASTPDSGATVNLIAGVNGRGTTSPLCNATAMITASQVVAGVVTLYSVNDFVPGLQVTLTGLTVAAFLNGIQFQVINVDPLGQWFQVYYTTDLGVVPADQAQTTDTGLATFNSIEVYRTSDGGGIYLFCGAVTNPINASLVPVKYDSGYLIAGKGTDTGTPGTYVWQNPNNVTSPSAFATVAVPAPVSASNAQFEVVQTCEMFVSSQDSIYNHATLTITKPFGLNITAGNSILIFAMTYDVGASSIADSQGNTYALIAQEVYTKPNGAAIVNSIYLANDVSAGATTVRLSFTGGHHTAFFGFTAVECSGLIGTAETPATISQATGTSLNPGSITTATAHEVVVSFIWSNLGPSGAASAYPGAFSLFGNQVLAERLGDNFNGTTQQIAAAFQVQTSIVTIAPTWFASADLDGVGITLALPLYTYNLSDGLTAQQFDLTVPAGIGVTGIEVDFNASFNGTASDGVLAVQLVQGGVPVGAIRRIPLQVLSSAPYVLGGPGNTWGFRWQPTDVNNPAWGVRFTATQKVGGTDATFGVSDVNVRVTGSTSTGWFFNDFTTDAGLDILLIAPQNHLNDPPPGAPGSSVNQVVGTITRYWQGRIWMAVGNFVYFDAGPDCTNGIPEEAWPPANRFQFVGPVIGLEPTADGVGMLVYLADRVNAILGGPETISFYPTDALSNFGISSPNAIFRDGSIIGQFTTQKQYFELIGLSKQETGEHVADYLTENFTAAKTYATMHRDGLDVGVFLSNGVDQVLRYGSNIGAWSVPSFPIFGAGALRSIETSVGITTLMLASPTGGVTSITIPTPPRSGLSIGAGTPWLNPNNITFGNPSDYATVALTAESSQILAASDYPFNLPENAVISGVEIIITGTGPVNSEGASNAGLGSDIPVTPGTAWITPNNVTLNTPGTYARAILNAPVTANNQYGSFHANGQTIAITQIEDDSGNPGVWAILLGTFSADQVAAATSVIVTGFLNAGNNGTFSIIAVSTGEIIIALDCVPEIHAATAVTNTGNGPTWTITVTATGEPINIGDTAFMQINGRDPFGIPGTATTIASVMDNKGNSWLPVAPIQATESGRGFFQMWYAVMQTAIPLTQTLVLTVTEDSPAGNPAVMTVLAFQNFTGVGALLSSVQNSGASAGTWSSGTLNPTQEVFALSYSYAQSSFNLTPTGYTVPQASTWGNGGGNNSQAEYEVAAPGAVTDTSWGQLNPEVFASTLAAFAVGAAVQSDLLLASTYGFTVPAGSTILGVKVQLTGLQSVVSATTSITAMLTVPGGTVRTFNFGTSIGTVSYGGATDPWGLTLTATEINDPAFGVLVQAFDSNTGEQVEFDLSAARVTVWYSPTLTVTPLNAVAGAESDTFSLGTSNTTVVLGGSTDLWGMPWISPFVVNASTFGFGIQSSGVETGDYAISIMNVRIFYQAPGNYLYARDLTTWSDAGLYGENNGTPYESCFVTIGSISLSQLGGNLLPLQHIVGYFDAVGTLNNGASSQPDIWILPNEVNDTKGVGFIQLPEILQEPPIGQNHPSLSIQALRYSVNMMNSQLASQFIHHLQVKIQFEPESAPNTIKAIAFKEDQS